MLDQRTHSDATRPTNGLLVSTHTLHTAKNVFWSGGRKPLEVSGFAAVHVRSVKTVNIVGYVSSALFLQAKPTLAAVSSYAAERLSGHLINSSCTSKIY